MTDEINQDMSDKKPERTKVTARWTLGDERIMINFLLEEKGAGRGAAPQCGFTPPTWAVCATLLKGKEIPGTMPKMAVHCHQKYNKLKANYKTVKELRTIDGMGWDTVRSVLIGSADVWATINPKLSKWSKKAFPFYKEIGSLCDNIVGIGPTQVLESDQNQIEQEPRPDSGSVASDEWISGILQVSDVDELSKEYEPINSPILTRLAPSTPACTSQTPPSPIASGSRFKKRKADSELSPETLGDRIEHVLTNLVTTIKSSLPDHSPALPKGETEGISPVVRAAMTRVEDLVGWPDEFKVQCLTLFLLFPDTASGFMAIKSQSLAQGVLRSMINLKLPK
ncbi:hypothetical protein CROQUDRAFT_92301 [Cronartium quercuum f. sp. fusiforme G11]|uniref:Myb/SANT-like domain-containing protein n=1 Tax=Cronartium quercuum f. sp. fusiforme G11 TaxID=708437 RepID=A0A9P6TBZ8_9BASI|nr:hypothetical protein CROQUDRAFT_92301 [Cronartium quercuum f. sp. fusiforme G11]